MEDGEHRMSWETIAAILGAIAVSVAAVSAIRIWVWRLVRGIKAFLRYQDAAAKLIAEQLRKNGGGSLIDQIHALKEQIAELKEDARQNNEEARLRNDEAKGEWIGLRDADKLIANRLAPIEQMAESLKASLPAALGEQQRMGVQQGKIIETLDAHGERIERLEQRVFGND